MKKDLVVLIATNGPYLSAFGDVWRACYAAHWPGGPVPYFVGPTTEIAPDVINTPGDLGWNRNTLYGLKMILEAHDPEAILLLHEDYLIGPQRFPGDYDAKMSKVLECFRLDPRLETVGCVRKDPEVGPYFLWPEMLGVHDLAPGILPVDPSGISVWRALKLERHLEEVIALVSPERDLGRNGVAEFSHYGAIFARERGELHARVKRSLVGKDGILDVLSGVTLAMGRLHVTNPEHQRIVEGVMGCPIHEVPGLRDLARGERFDLGAVGEASYLEELRKENP